MNFHQISSKSDHGRPKKRQRTLLLKYKGVLIKDFLLTELASASWSAAGAADQPAKTSGLGVMSRSPYKGFSSDGTGFGELIGRWRGRAACENKCFVGNINVIVHCFCCLFFPEFVFLFIPSWLQDLVMFDLGFGFYMKSHAYCRLETFGNQQFWPKT